MKEYKLSRISKYSVFYLLCGLFMFFFMFAIFSLSSHALSNQTISLNLLSQRPTSSDGSCTVTIGSPSFNVTIPSDGSLSQDTSLYFSYGYKFVATTTSGNFDLYSGNSGFTATQYVSSNNTFVSSLNVPSDIGSFYLNGQLISVDFELSFTGSYSGSTYLNHINVGGTTQSPSSLGYGSFQSNNYGYAYGTTSISVPNFNLSKNTNFVSVSSSSSSSSSIFNFSDYSSYSPVNLLSSVTLSDGSVSPAGSIINFSFNDFPTSSYLLTNNFIPFVTYGVKDYILVCTLTVPYGVSVPSIRAIIREGSTNIFDTSSGSVFLLTEGSSYQTYAISFNFSLGVEGETHVYKVNAFNTDVGYSLVNQSLSFYELKYTLSDYMSYVKNNYNDINPSVIDTNTNSGQTVSDVNTINSFEAATFSNFDSLAESSGLNSFSLTSNTHVANAMNFLSTCIVTVYNGFPSDLKWLIQCIGIFGIFALLLSVFGRVGKRINNE